MQLRDMMTVRELLDLRDQLALPHFQRGHVWGSRDKAELFESLRDRTPIGTFLLWESETPAEHGQALLEAKGPLRYLVIDGQQRLSTMISDLLPATSGVPPFQPEEPQWCVNLNAVPEFKQLLKDPGGRRRAMFAEVRDPRNVEALRQTKKHRGGESFWNYIPLWVFYLGSEDDFLAQARACCKVSTQVPLADALLKLKKSLAEMLNPQVLVVKYGRDATFDEMLRLYVRINSTGNAAQAEERAFAEIQGVDSGAHQRIRDIFKDVHPQKTGMRDYLKRMRESQLGFKFFLRTFIQVCAWHLEMSKEALSPSLDFINRESDMRKLQALKSLAPQLWERTRRIVRFLSKHVLEEQLLLDSPRFLSATFPLLPLIQCLVMFPDLIDAKYASPLAAHALAVLLADPSQQIREELMARILRLKTSAAALHLLERRTTEWQSGVEGVVGQASGERHRAVLLLYGLLRRTRAHDFSYQLNEVDPARMPKDGQQAVISEGWEPEAQHIVPLDTLKRAVLEASTEPVAAPDSDLPNVATKGPRGRKGPANALGNLTYISRALNSFEHGLGASPFKSKEEPLTNLKAHFLSDASKPELKTWLDSLMQAKPGEKIDAAQYGKFIKVRAEIISSAFAAWIKDLLALTPGGQPTGRPEAPLIHSWILQEFVGELRSSKIDPKRVAELERFLQSIVARMANADHVASQRVLRLRIVGTLPPTGDEVLELKLSDHGNLSVPPRKTVEASALAKSLKTLVSLVNARAADFDSWSKLLGLFDPLLAGKNPALPELSTVEGGAQSAGKSKRKPVIASASKFLELVRVYSSSEESNARRILDGFDKAAAESGGSFVVGYQTTTANLYWLGAKNKKRRIFALTSQAEFGIRLSYLKDAGRQDVAKALVALATQMLPDPDGRVDFHYVRLSGGNADLVLAFLEAAMRQIQPMLLSGEREPAAGPNA